MECIEKEMPDPGFESGLLWPQRSVLTTRRSRLTILPSTGQREKSSLLLQTMDSGLYKVYKNMIYLFSRIYLLFTKSIIFKVFFVQSTFCDNCRNFCALLSISRQTGEFIIYAMRQGTLTRADNERICYRKKQMTVFNASVPSLTVNFVITLSKQSADPRLL